jgi:hypothetical protein
VVVNVQHLRYVTAKVEIEDAIIAAGRRCRVVPVRRLLTMQKRLPIIALVSGMIMLVFVLSDWLGGVGQELASLKTIILLVSFLLWLITIRVTWFDPRLRSSRSRALVIFMLVMTGLLVILFVLNIAFVDSPTASQFIEFSTFLWMAGDMVWISVTLFRLQQAKTKEVKKDP